MAVRSFQVTLSGGVDHIATQRTLAKWVIFQNNAATAVTLGDPATVTATNGLVMAAAAQHDVPTSAPVGQTDLATWAAKGTAAALLNVIWDDGTTS